MKKIFIMAAAGLVLWSCNAGPKEVQSSVTASEVAGGGQSAVQDDESAKDVVKIAVGSKDHSTLVTAVQKAELVDALSNAGPFTVFAPVNAAFDKLPKGTVEELLKPENKAKLQDILQYHVYVGNLSTTLMQDGQTLNQVNGGNIALQKTADGKITINGTSTIVASVQASNGWVHVIDGVLVPSAK